MPDETSGQHWHVTAGTVGCLPEGNGCFLDRDEADRYFDEELADYQDAGSIVENLSPDEHQRGTNVSRYAAIAPINYLMVEECNDGLDCPLYRETVEDAWDLSHGVPGEPS